MKIYKTFDRILSKVEAATACTVLIIIVLSGTAQIFCRYVLKSSLIWTEELMRYLFVWLSFITASIAVREHKHISVDFLTTYLPAKVNMAFYFISRVAMVVYIGFMIPAGIKTCIATSANRSTILPITWNYVYAALPVGMVLILLSMISVFPDDVQKFRAEMKADKEGKK